MVRTLFVFLYVAGCLPHTLDAQSFPVVSANGVVNSASFASPTAPNGSLAPGSMATVFGSNLAAGPVQATTTTLPTSLGDTDSLTVGAAAAPLFFVSPGLINFQVPFDTPRGTVNVAVTRGGKTSAAQRVEIVPASPGIFTMNSSGQGAIVNLRGSLVDRNAPAAPGDFVVVLCTGLGATTPAVPTGVAVPIGTLAVANLPVSATVGDIPATVSFAGLAPGYVGLYQVNLQIPAGVDFGDSVPLALTQNGVASNPATLAIHAPSTSPRLEFSPFVNVQNGASNFSGEPSLQIGRDGTMWITDLSPAQIWKSTDRGATWSHISPPLSVGGSDLDGAQDDSGRVHILDLARNGRCFYYYRSTDGGKSFDIMATPGGGVWLRGDGGCDALPTRFAVDRPWVATFGADTIFIIGRENPNGTGINISVDGGRTFSYTAVSQQLFPELGAMAIDPLDGTLYLLAELLGTFDPDLGRNPATGLRAAMSADGATFSFSTVASNSQFDFGGSAFPSLAVDAAHNVYAAWADNSSGTFDIYVSVSRDRAKSWSTPVRVSHGLTVSTYPTLVAGDAGRAAVAWYGTPDPAKTRNDAHGANWYVYAAISTNAADDQPVFESTRVSEQPFHHGSICAHLSLCEGNRVASNADLPPEYEQGIADFFRMAIDPSGALNVVWHDTTASSQSDHFARQTGGRLLKEATGEPTQPAWYKAARTLPTGSKINR